jgi:uncharacterized repeat protein (TIGR03803 family)
LVRDAQGNLYGAAQTGGANGRGTVWELKVGSSTITPLASFDGTNGSEPRGGLVRDAQGNLYGTTRGGGAGDLGTVWELKAGSSTITALASFDGANGSESTGGLVRDAQGNLYGTAVSGPGVAKLSPGAIWGLSRKRCLEIPTERSESPSFPRVSCRNFPENDRSRESSRSVIEGARAARHLLVGRTRETDANRWTPMEARTILPRERLT